MIDTFKTSLTVSSLCGNDLKGLFGLAFDPDVDFKTVSSAMSPLQDDEAPDGTSVKSYARNYFLGADAPLPIPFSEDIIEGLAPIDAFDLLSRSGKLAAREAWVISHLDAFIDNPRVFAVASRIGHDAVIDCFLEMHSREWFGPLVDLVDGYAASPVVYEPYNVSDELSAKRIGPNYFLHSGTNDWNKAWLPTTQWDDRWDSHLLGWKSQISNAVELARQLEAKSYQFLFVPEKDTLARASDPGIFQSGLMPMLILMELIDHAPPETVLFPVKDLIANVSTTIRLQMPDSHLCAEDYWVMFYRVMERFGLDPKLKASPTCEHVEFYSDLGNKFEVNNAVKQTIAFDLPDAVKIYGEDDIQVPLRNNHVVFKNKSAPIRSSLLILGDSHASVGANPMLTYIARHFFETVEFAWSPFNVHGYEKSYFRQSQYDYVLFETSQRFATPKTGSPK